MVNSENFIIPKKINVGYQERSDCYTKNLDSLLTQTLRQGF